MEIIYRTNEIANKSNFEYCSDLYKGKKVLNGFNKLSEELLGESISDSDFYCKNVFFNEEIVADLYLCYPFKVVLKEEIKFGSLHELISEIRRAYNQAYYNERKLCRKRKITAEEFNEKTIGI